MFDLEVLWTRFVEADLAQLNFGFRRKAQERTVWRQSVASTELPLERTEGTSNTKSRNMHAVTYTVI